MKKSCNISSQEKSLFDLIKEKYPKTQRFKDKKFEIDIYIPELRKGIEFDGTYWHSVKGLKRSRPNWSDEDLENYHAIKDEYFLSKDILLLHIKEEDWIKNQEKCIQRCFKFLSR